VTDEQIRFNSYYRLLGWTIPGKEDATDFKVESYNQDFHATFEDILKQVVNGILDKAINEAATDPDALNRTLVSLQTGLKDHNNNLIPSVAAYWAVSFEKLLDLLDNGRSCDIHLYLHRNLRRWLQLKRYPAGIIIIMDGELWFTKS
jgi:hypothetical protein